MNRCGKSSTFLAHLILAGLMLLATVSAHAMWVEDGTPISTALSSQQYPQLIADGSNGAIIAWQDNRNGNYDVYAQRVNTCGTPLWAANGVAVCTATNSQSSVSLVSNGAGGAVLAWQDSRSGSYDIYAQMLDQSGIGLWAANGVTVCGATGNQYYPAAVTDADCGAIVAWEDTRSGNYDIYVQKVDFLGTMKWTANGVAICTATGTQRYIAIVPDGGGGAYIAWTDERSATQDIYIQRVNSSGTPQWTSDGVAVCTASANQLLPMMILDDYGANVIVTWYDSRGGTYDIYAQKVSSSGVAQWTPNGVPVCTAANSQSVPQIVTDMAYGAIITWQDQRSTTRTYAQRLNSSGVAQWTPDGVSVFPGAGAQYNPMLVSDGAGGAIISCLESLADRDVRAQRINASGVIQWGTSGVQICTADEDQWSQTMATDDDGGALITWFDYRSGNSDIYAQHVDQDGRDGFLAPEIFSVRDIPGDQGGEVFLSWEASRMDVFKDDAMSYYTIWRSIDAVGVAAVLEEGGEFISDCGEVGTGTRPGTVRFQELNGSTYFWELVGTVYAYYLDSYGKPVPTLFDSTSVSTEWHYFQVIAHSNDPKVFFISAPDSGYSVDDLSPLPPEAVSGDYSYPPAELVITWEPNSEVDLSHYAVYKGSYEGFVPGEGNLLGTTEDTLLVDTSFDPDVDNYYKVSAWDVHENESGYALLRPEEITSASGPPLVPTVTLLEQNVPNPFNPVTRIRFSVSEPGLVRLTVYDVGGRPVRVLVEGERQANRYEVMWDGRDNAGRLVASGVYLYQLEAPGYRDSKKMVLLK